jgi:hypothetical protein
MKTSITGTPVLVPLIRADCTQMGLAVDASNDNGETWRFVQLHPYTVRETPTVQAYSQAIDPARDRAEYFATLDARGVRYIRDRKSEN